MPNDFRVSYDPALDCFHLVYEGVVLETPEDVRAWARDLERAVAHRKDKVDAILDLSGLTVKPAVVALYDQVRQEVIAARVRRIYRYGGSALVRTKLLTSAALHGQAPNVFGTYEEAVAALRADRARGD